MGVIVHGRAWQTTIIASNASSAFSNTPTRPYADTFLRRMLTKIASNASSAFSNTPTRLYADTPLRRYVLTPDAHQNRQQRLVRFF
jgi:hypothetical protein